MTSFTISHQADAAELERLRTPRDDSLLAERPSDRQDCFALESGPFENYERRLTITPAGTGFSVAETVDYRIAIPVWRFLLAIPIRRELARRRPAGTAAWWAPPDRFDAVTARVLSLLAIASIVTGYLGAIVGQTATFAADEFGASDRAQGRLLAAVRAGTIITLAIGVLSDRWGRRRLLLWSMAASSAVTVLGALSTGLWTLGLTQAIGRGFATGIAILIAVMAAESVPRNSRAYAVSVLTLTAGLGAGMVVWFLPLADLSIRAWRLIYILPVIGLPVTWWLATGLRESPRFVTSHSDDATSSRDARSGPQPSIIVSRLVLIATVAFLVSAFAAPGSQFRNEFLRDERGFSAAQVSLFVLITSTPVGLGVALAGKFADKRGRRMIGAIGVAGGALLTVLTFASRGPVMWSAGIFASIIGAMAAPALGVYNAEMFGTRRRGRANGIISLIALAGSACGLLLVGELADRLDSFGAAFAILAIGPAVVVVLVLTRYPETAHLALEDINPEDGPTGENERQQSRRRPVTRPEAR